VVGVALNQAVWFALHTLFPDQGIVNWFAVIVGLAAFAGMWRWKWDVVPVVLGCGVLGLLHHLGIRKPRRNRTGVPTNFTNEHETEVPRGIRAICAIRGPTWLRRKASPDRAAREPRLPDASGDSHPVGRP